jgi:hypothetical protein
LCLFAWWPWSIKPSETASIWVFSVVSMGRCSWGWTFDFSWFSKFWWTKSELWDAHKVLLVSPKSCTNPWSESGDRWF